MDDEQNSDRKSNDNKIEPMISDDFSLSPTINKVLHLI